MAGNFFARQGYPRAIYIQVNTATFESTTNVLAVPEADGERLADLYDLDLSPAKSLKSYPTRKLTPAGCRQGSSSWLL